jgi:hypothetical protein
MSQALKKISCLDVYIYIYMYIKIMASLGFSQALTLIEHPSFSAGASRRSHQKRPRAWGSAMGDIFFEALGTYKYYLSIYI